MDIAQSFRLDFFSLHYRINISGNGCNVCWNHNMQLSFGMKSLVETHRLSKLKCNTYRNYSKDFE